MLKIIITTVILIIGTPYLYSQTDFRQASIINNSSDTLNGYIYYSSLSKLEKSIYFKTSKTDDDVQEFLPKDIKRFTFKKDNEIFVSISKNDSTSIFANLIVQGDINLYRTSKYYYLENKEYGINNLFVLSISGEISKEKQIQRNHGKLSLYVKDCEDVSSKINESSFSLSKLTKIITNYNRCKSPSETQEHSKIINNKKTYTIGLSAYTAINYTSIKVNHYQVFDYKQVKSSSITPSFGLEIKNNFPKISEYFSIIIGMGIGKEEYLFQNKETSFGNKTQTIKLKSNYTFLEIPLYLSSYFNLNRTKLSIDFGVLRKINIDSEHNLSELNEVNNTKTSIYDVRPFEDDFYKATNYIVFQVGVVFPKSFIPESELKISFKTNLNTEDTEYNQSHIGINYSIVLF